MGSIINAIGDVFEDIVAATLSVFIIVLFPFSLVLASICDACEEFMSDQLEIFFGFLGITDSDIIAVQVQDQKLIQDNTFYKNLMTQVALEHQKTQMGIIDLLSVKSQGMRGSIQKYSRYGKNVYTNGLPDTTINTVSVNKDIVDEQVQLDVGVDITVVDVKVKVPKETEWVPYRMTQLYGMNQASMVFTYLADTWVMTGFYYDFGAGVYKVNAYLQSTPATTVVIDIGNYVANVGYVVTYVKDGTTDSYYWVYFLNSGNVTLDSARNYLTDLDMLPIVELRKGSVSVTVDKESIKYKQTQEILGFIGIDVDTICNSIDANPDVSSVTAAYIYFGAEIGSSNPLQAKMVYSVLEYLFFDPTIESNGQHQIRVTEGDYNSSISWEKQERLVVSRTGVTVGTYEGGIGSIDVDGKFKYYGWVRKQETSDEYVEYRIWNVSAITVIMKAGLKDATFLVLSPGTPIVMPLSQFFLSKFTPIEQGQLFPEILRLATYAADVQHLRWYETAEFMNLIQIVLVVVAVVLFILSLPAGGSAGDIFYAAAQTLLIGMAVGYALQLLLQQIDNPYLRAVVAVIAMAAAAAFGGANIGNSEVMIYANLITEAVTTYADAFMEGIAEQFAELSAESAMFASMIEQRQAEIDAKQDGVQSFLSTVEAARLSNVESVSAYIEGVDLKYYRAVQMQYDFELIKSMRTMTQVYDYDQHYRLGVM